MNALSAPMEGSHAMAASDAGLESARGRRIWPAGLAIILLVALAARLAYLAQFSALPFFDQPVGDSAAHLQRAADIAHGVLLPARPFYYCSIYYPYFLALVLGVFHGSLWTVSLLQLVAGTIFVGVIATASRLTFGTPAGLATGALAALYGPSAFFEADILGVVWGQLALSISILACLWWLSHPERRLRLQIGVLFAAGLALGAAAIERPNLLVAAAAVFVWLAAVAPRDRVKSVFAAGAGLSLPLLMVLALNVAGTGQWVPLTTSGGINLSLGYHSGADGTYDEPWEREAPEFSAQHIEPEEAMTAWAARKLGHPVTTQQASAYWGREAVSWMRRHPGETLRITLRKAALLLNSAEVPNHLDFAFIRERAPALRFMPIDFGPLLALAAIGAAALLLRRRRRPAIALLLAMSGAAWLSVVPFTVADRYRAPMVPPLLILAGAGIYVLIGLVREREARRDPRMLAALALGVLVLAASSIPLMKPLRGRDYWMIAQAYERHGQMREAVAAYESAVREEPNNGELLNNLASIYKRTGDRSRAVALLRRAVLAEPGLAYPHKNLGMLMAVQGQYDSAQAELERAYRIDSTDVEVVATIGAIAAERGHRAQAHALFERARRMSPDDARLERLIAHYEPDSARGR